MNATGITFSADEIEEAAAKIGYRRRSARAGFYSRLFPALNVNYWAKPNE